MLINPPDDSVIQGTIPPELGHSKLGCYPPLGLLYIASSLVSKHPDYEVKIIDAAVDNLNALQVGRAVEEWRPDIVGLSTYTFTLIDSLDVARIAKTVAPGTVVVVGGFHPTLYPRETLCCSPHIDIAVRGEAEYTFCSIAEAIFAGSAVDCIPGVCTKKGKGELHVSDQIPLVPDLDSLPFPDRRLTDYKKHSCALGAGGLSTSILSSRGCPFQCKYCYINVRQYRLRSLDNLLAEIKECLTLGIEEYFFMDDLFNISKERILGFCQRVLQEGLKIKWCFRGRIDQIDEAVLQAARRAGCSRIHYGIESGVQSILARIGKKTSIQLASHITGLTRRYGIEVSSNIMIGLPGETRQDTEETIRFALDLSTDYLQASIFTPYPETPFYQEALKAGMYKQDYWRQFALRPSKDFKPHVWEEHYSPDELAAKLREFYLRFYLRARFLIRYLRHLTSVSSLALMLKNAVTFYRLITGGTR